MGNDNGEPPSEEAYPDWLSARFGGNVGPVDQNYYENTADSLRAQFEASPFWLAFCTSLRDRDQAHRIETTYPLLAHSNMAHPAVECKPYNSLILKSYRKNVLENKNWPEAPSGGWVTPNNWLTMLGDIVRTTVVVKYLDGVNIVCELLNEIAEAQGVARTVEYEARDDGYYAAHSTIVMPLRINSKSWESTKQDTSIEIQVSTQVQEVIKALTHKFYEQRRHRARDETKKWQWEYRSEEFVPNYLGHILHYVEGMMMEIRDKQELGHG